MPGGVSGDAVTTVLALPGCGSASGEVQIYIIIL